MSLSANFTKWDWRLKGYVFMGKETHEKGRIGRKPRDFL